MFRTPSGQTGKTAYTYELAQIMNIHRELSARMKRLAEAMAEELPETATYEMSIASKQFPDATATCDRDCMRRQLEMCHTATSFSYETVTNMLRTLKS